MYKMLTTSFALLVAFASLALARPQQEVTITETTTVTVSNPYTLYTTTSQTTYTAPSPISTGSVTHEVKVGANGLLQYDPNNVTANVGDKILFTFYPKNHTVTESSYNNPCEKLEASTGVPGFSSGFKPVSNTTANGTVTFLLTVNSTDFVGIYCGQTGHCGMGMVFALNPNENQTVAGFIANALSSNSSSPTPTGASGASTISATGSGATASGTSSSTNGNGAISTSANLGLAAALSIVGFILAL